jgi:hypothetical protein
MAESGGKPRKPKPPKGRDAGVLGSLPSSRPTRMARQSRQADPARTPASRRAPAKPKPSAAKPSATPISAARGAPAKSRAATGTGRAARTRIQRPGPRPVRAGAPNLDAPGDGRDAAPAGPKAPSGTELVTTVVQAGIELAQIGLTVSGQLVRGALRRIPRP